MSESTNEVPTDQGTDYKVGYKKPPKNRQFGQPEGNPRNPGGWVKKDTPRYKLERLLKLGRDEWRVIARGEAVGEDGEKYGGFEQLVCEILLNEPSPLSNQPGMTPMEQIRAICMLIDQAYGKSPQLQVVAQADDKEDAKAYVKGFLIP